MAHSVGVMLAMMAAIRFSIASRVLSPVLRSRVLVLAKTCSIGSRSGLTVQSNRHASGCGTGLGDGVLDRDTLVTGEVVQDHDVTRLQGRNERLLDPGGEALLVDRPIEAAGCAHPVVTEGSDQGHGSPVTMGSPGDQPLALGVAAMRPGHVGLGCVDRFALDHRERPTARVPSRPGKRTTSRAPRPRPIAPARPPGGTFS